MNDAEGLEKPPGDHQVDGMRCLFRLQRYDKRIIVQTQANPFVLRGDVKVSSNNPHRAPLLTRLIPSRCSHWSVQPPTAAVSHAFASISNCHRERIDFVDLHPQGESKCEAKISC